MKVEYEIYQLIEKSSGSKMTLSERASSGLTAYATDNDLEKLLGQIPAEKRGRCLEMFMRPILSLPPEEISLYFETYSLRLAFTRTKNKIQSEAAKRFHDKDYRCNFLPALSEDFNSIIKEINNYPGIYEKFAERISDCMLDLDYISGRSENFSISLAHRVGLRV